MLARMQYLRRHGFRASGPLSTTDTPRYLFKEFPEVRLIVVICNDTRQCVLAYRLDKKQWTAFKNNRLSLLPPGCISLSDRKVIRAHEVVFTGQFKSQAHILSIINDYVVALDK